MTFKVSEVSTSSRPDPELAVAPHTSVIGHAAVTLISLFFFQNLFCCFYSLYILYLLFFFSVQVFSPLFQISFCTSLSLSLIFQAVFLSCLSPVSIVSRASDTDQHQRQTLSETAAKLLWNPTRPFRQCVHNVRAVYVFASESADK